jgi:hypothetical protein
MKTIGEPQNTTLVSTWRAMDLARVCRHSWRESTSPESRRQATDTDWHATPRLRHFTRLRLGSSSSAGRLAARHAAFNVAEAAALHSLDGERLLFDVIEGVPQQMIRFESHQQRIK